MITTRLTIREYSGAWSPEYSGHLRIAVSLEKSRLKRPWRLYILNIFNKQLVKQERRILLFIDNVSSHDPTLKDKFSNINIIFLPKNTTSRLQPLDAGIIKNFKVHYRRFAQIDSTSLTVSALVTKVDVLTAIRWIKKGKDEVRPQTIINCFRKTGALPQDQGSDEVSFAGLEEDDMTLAWRSLSLSWIQTPLQMGM